MKFDTELVMLLGVLLIGGIVIFIVAFVLKYRRSQIEFVHERELLQRKFNEDVLQARIEISEQTLKRVSMEIHDNVCQSLTVARIQMNLLSPENLEEMKRSGSELIGRSLNDLRNIAHSMNGNFLNENGFKEAIERELKLVCMAGDMQYHSTWKSDMSNHFKEIEVILFRCVQEALNNCLKHSKATKILFSYRELNDILVLEVSDNGIGISNESITGLGLKNMRDRLELLKGEFLLEKLEPTGTKMVLKVPKNEMIKKEFL